MNESLKAEIVMLKEELANNPSIIRACEINEQIDKINEQILSDHFAEDIREALRQEDYEDYIDAKMADDGDPENDKGENWR